LECGARVECQAQSQNDTQEDGDAVERVSGKRGGPHLGAIDAGNTYLAIRKFQQAGEIGLHERGHQALGQEHDGPAGLLQREGKRIVVTEGVLPDVHHADLLKDRTANGGASTPAKIVGLRPEHAHDTCVPGGQKRRRDIAAIGNKPSHGGCGTNSGIAERSDHVVQPGFARAPIGIHEDQDFKFRRKLLDCGAQVVDLFAATLRLAGDDYAGFYARRCSHAFHDAVSRVRFRSENEENFEVLVIELGKRDKIALQAGFHSTARAKDGGARSVETWVGGQPAAHVNKPLDALPEQVEPGGDLQNRQNVE